MDRHARANRSIAARLIALPLLLLLTISPASAFTIVITPAAPRTIYLQVGVGSFTGFYSSGGTPQDNSTINVVSLTVPAAQVGTGVSQTMTSNSTASNSFYDNRVFCSTPNQVYIGGFYRRADATAGSAATLRATKPANLVNASGDTIPFSQISWTSSGIGDAGAQPFPSGTFAAGTQTIGTIPRNRWSESCHTFRYANTSLRPAGTYTGRVTYTLTAP